MLLFHLFNFLKEHNFENFKNQQFDRNLVSEKNSYSETKILYHTIISLGVK